MKKTRPTALLFTTFPVASETFLQREVRQLMASGHPLRLISLWGGADSFEGHPILRLRRPTTLATALCRLLPWVFGNATVLHHWTAAMGRRSPPNALNLGENLWGLAAAAALQPILRRDPPAHLHAVWASMPATTAAILGESLHIPWSFSGHAYDLFEDGGDWLLPEKISRASFVRTSTEQGRQRLLALGAPSERVNLIRRGLESLPEFLPNATWHEPLRILSVGRLVEKKGYPTLLRILAATRDAGIPCTARILGDGPLKLPLQRLRSELRLEQHLHLEGAQPYDVVREAYRWADVFLFTGQVARSGDRDGLPNVIPEAMAHGLPVLATPYAGVPEVISEGETGFLLPPDQPNAWSERIRSLQNNPTERDQVRKQARHWVETHFNLQENVAQLRGLLGGE